MHHGQDVGCTMTRWLISLHHEHVCNSLGRIQHGQEAYYRIKTERMIHLLFGVVSVPSSERKQTRKK